MATLVWQRRGLAAMVGFLATVVAMPSGAAAKGVTITVENLLPADGSISRPYGWELTMGVLMWPTPVPPHRPD